MPEPTPAPQAADKSYEGASAFVEYAVAVINRAYLTGDTEPLESISLPDCATCRSLIDGINEIYSRGEQYRGGQASIQEIETIAISENVVPTVETLVDVSTLERIDVDGKVLKSVEATMSATLLWDLSWSDAWALAEIREAAQ